MFCTDLRVLGCAAAAAGLLVLQCGSSAVAQQTPAGASTSVNSPAAQRTYRYDDRQRIVGWTDRRGISTDVTLTAEGKIASTRSSGGFEVHLTYDAAGRLLSVQQPSGGVTRLARDANGNLVSSTDPLGRVYRYTYDAANYLSSLTDPAGKTIQFSSTLASKTYERRASDGSRLSFQYDAAGRLIAADNGAFTVGRTFDDAGHIVRVDYPTIGKSVQYGYDASGRRSSMTAPNGGQTRYEYGPRDLAAIVAPDGSRFGFARDSEGRVTVLSYPNGVTGRWGYDAAGRIIGVGYYGGDGNYLAGTTYSYDDRGNVAARRDSAGVVTYFKYDAAGQLIGEEGLLGTTAYSYGPGGNRSSLQRDGKSISYSYDVADQLLQAGPVHYAYDSSGRLSEQDGPDGKQTYSYDAWGRLIRIVNTKGVNISYEYAPTGQRIARDDGKQKLQFVYDRQSLLQELGPDGRTLATYINAPGIDRPLAMVRGGKIYYFHADGIGNIIALTDGSGNLIANYSYDAFGATLSGGAAAKNPFAFTAREWEPALGLYYFRARYYDPQTGRFLSRDPLVGDVINPIEFNRYLYVNNNPTRFWDPMGLVPVSRAWRNMTKLAYGGKSPWGTAAREDIQEAEELDQPEAIEESDDELLAEYADYQKALANMGDTPDHETIDYRAQAIKEGVDPAVYGAEPGTEFFWQAHHKAELEGMKQELAARGLEPPEPPPAKAKTTLTDDPGDVSTLKPNDSDPLKNAEAMPAGTDTPQKPPSDAPQSKGGSGAGAPSPNGVDNGGVFEEPAQPASAPAASGPAPATGVTAPSSTAAGIAQSIQSALNTPIKVTPGENINLGTGQGVAAGGAMAFAACLGRKQTPEFANLTVKDCLGEAGWATLTGAEVAAVGALYPPAIAALAAYGAAEGISNIGSLISEWNKAQQAGVEEGRALSGMGNLVSQNAMNDNLRRCDYVHALRLAQILQAQQPPPSWLPTIMPNILRGAKAEDRVTGLLKSAAASNDSQQIAGFLKEARAAATDTPCLNKKIDTAAGGSSSPSSSAACTASTSTDPGNNTCPAPGTPWLCGDPAGQFSLSGCAIDATDPNVVASLQKECRAHQGILYLPYKPQTSQNACPAQKSAAQDDVFVPPVPRTRLASLQSATGDTAVDSPVRAKVTGTGDTAVDSPASPVHTPPAPGPQAKLEPPPSQPEPARLPPAPAPGPVQNGGEPMPPIHRQPPEPNKPIVDTFTPPEHPQPPEPQKKIIDTFTPPEHPQPPTPQKKIIDTFTPPQQGSASENSGTCKVIDGVGYSVDGAGHTTRAAICDPKSAAPSKTSSQGNPPATPGPSPSKPGPLPVQPLPQQAKPPVAKPSEPKVAALPLQAAPQPSQPPITKPGETQPAAVPPAKPSQQQTQPAAAPLPPPQQPAKAASPAIPPPPSLPQQVAKIAQPPVQPECRKDGKGFHMSQNEAVTIRETIVGHAACAFHVNDGPGTHIDTVSITGRPRGGVTTQSDGHSVTYQPSPQFSGADSYVLKVCGRDSGGSGCAVLTYEVTVQ